MKTDVGLSAVRTDTDYEFPTRGSVRTADSANRAGETQPGCGVGADTGVPGDKHTMVRSAGDCTDLG